MASDWRGEGGGTDRFKKVGSRMQDPILDSLKSYWETLRAGRLAPYRSEVDPREFEHALENMFILEVVGQEMVRVRLAGMKLCMMMGMEVRGMSPRAFMMPEDRARFDLMVLDVVNKPSVTEMVVETVDYNGKSGTAYLLLMPLRSDFGEITRILGCISDNNEPFEAPVRFRITQTQSDPIRFSESAETPAEAAGFGEAAEDFRFEAGKPAFTSIEGGRPKAAKGESDDAPRDRSHLKLVSSQDD